MTATSPDTLIAALLSAGWELVGERAGLYKRLAVVVPGGAQQHALMVPLDPSYGDYQDLTDGVLSYLRRLAGDGARARRALDAASLIGRPGWHVENCDCMQSDGAVLNVDLRCNIL